MAFWEEGLTPVGAYSSPRDSEEINPYIALSDLAISLVLIVIFFVALDRLGLANFKYKHSMKAFDQAVQQELPVSIRPRWEQGRNDPPGVQRWVFDGRATFLPTDPTRPDAPPRLSPDGQKVFFHFARLLQRYHKDWWRIRVEGHTKPPDANASDDDWDLSARRAAVVVGQLENAGHIPPWYFAIAGRAGQNPLHSVYLCCEPETPEAANVEHNLHSQGVTFSIKDLRQDLKNDAAVKNALPKIRRDGTPYLVDVSDTGDTTVFTSRDDTQFRHLIDQFSRNERVEVLIEYTARGTSQSGSE